MVHPSSWAALPGSEAGTYLVRDYAFAIVPTPHLLPEVIREGNRKRPAGEQPSLLLVGGINFGRGRGRREDPRRPLAGNSRFPTAGGNRERGERPA